MNGRLINTATIHFAAACVFALSVVFPAVALGDLYTGSARSIDWLVDSSDEIVHLRVEGQAGAKLKANVVGTLKGRLTLVQFREATAPESRHLYRIHENDKGLSLLQFRSVSGEYWIKAGWRSEQPAEWLLFLRTDGQTWRLAQAINLTRPRETSSTAAITPTGEALRTKTQIVAAVKTRIKANRHLPKNCDRELLEGRGSNRFDEWYQATRRDGWYLATSQVEPVLGGVYIPISNDYWDAPDDGDLDEDVILLSVLVPADAKYKSVVFDRVDAKGHPGDRELLAVLNYPGKEAERTLQQLVDSRSVSGLTADRVLYYLRYRRDPANPLDKKLIGKWNILGRNETVELDLRADHTCAVNRRPTDVTRHVSGYEDVDGRGYWAIRDGRFWIGRSHVIRNGKWIPARREFFPPKLMLKINDDSIKLEGGPPMRRRR